MFNLFLVSWSNTPYSNGRSIGLACPSGSITLCSKTARLQSLFLFSLQIKINTNLFSAIIRDSYLSFSQICRFFFISLPTFYSQQSGLLAFTIGKPPLVARQCAVCCCCHLTLPYSQHILTVLPISVC